jgi:hypothetical protein
MLVALHVVQAPAIAPMALDFWWPLLEQARPDPAAEPQVSLGLAHLVIYVGGSSAQMHRVDRAAGVRSCKPGVGEEVQQQRTRWDKRVLVLRQAAAQHAAAHFSVYKSESDAKNDANGTHHRSCSAPASPTSSTPSRSTPAACCACASASAKDTKPRTFLFDTTSPSATRGAPQLVAARRIPSNWFDTRMVGSVENHPQYKFIEEKSNLHRRLPPHR